MTPPRDIIGIAKAVAEYRGNDDPNWTQMHLANFQLVAQALLDREEKLEIATGTLDDAYQDLGAELQKRKISGEPIPPIMFTVHSYLKGAIMRIRSLPSHDR